jgi:hypothetical protein
MKTLSLLLFALSFPVALRAEMPSLEALGQRRYVVRNGGYYAYPDDRTWRAEGGSGIWDWDMETGQLTRVRPLATQLMIGPYMDASIAALEDRYVVHHTSTLEFDAATNRFLRRYDSLAAEHGTWVFNGSAVTETAGRRHGLAPGYYGSVRCPSYDPGPSCGGEFPGAGFVASYHHNEAALNPFLFHRGMDPGDHQLRIAKIFGPAFPRPSISFDSKRGRFWFQSYEWTAPTTVLNAIVRFGYLPVENGLIQDPVIVETWEGITTHLSTGFMYDPSTDSLLGVWSPQGWATRRPADLSRAPEPLPAGIRPFAALSGEVPTIHEQVVPAIGNGPGANGTYWRSDVWFFNPSNVAMTFTARRVSDPRVVLTFELPPRGSMDLVDVLAKAGGGPTANGGDGITTDALVVESPYRWGEQLTVYSRTYTSDQQGSGTYGQSVPAVPSRYGYANNGTFVLDRRQPGQYRHNLGVVNDGQSSLAVKISAYGREETLLVPPATVANMTLDNIPWNNHPLGSMLVAVETGRPVPIWLAMIDNKTGDGTFVPFSTFALEGALDATIAIPQIASVPGAHGTRWRSDLYGELSDNVAVEFTQTSAFLRTIFYPADPASCDGQPVVRSRVPSTRWLFPDIANQMEGCSDNHVRGALELHTGAWTSAYSRTYTTREDGGTLGDILPQYPMGGWPVQHFSGLRVSDAFRVNLGLYNGLDYPVVHRLLLFDAAGEEIARREITLAARQSLQAPLGDFLGALPKGLYGLTVLPLDAPARPGRSWAYVSIIDNATGDPTNLW